MNTAHSACMPARSSSSKRASTGLSTSHTPSSEPSLRISGTTISEREAPSQKMWSGNAFTSGTTWVWRDTAAAPVRDPDAGGLALERPDDQAVAVAEIESAPVDVRQRVIDQRGEVGRVGDQVGFAAQQAGDLVEQLGVQLGLAGGGEGREFVHGRCAVAESRIIAQCRMPSRLPNRARARIAPKARAWTISRMARLRLRPAVGRARSHDRGNAPR